MDNLLALVDCNNFYASCERVFNPKLENKPIVILSNNDGCIVARSDEAKKMGIPFGKPYFKIKDELEKKNVFAFSSNYELYGDMSRRVMDTLGKFTPELEVYSIDEAFLSLTGIKKNMQTYGFNIKNTVKKWTGIPVSVGIAKTKTLAKVANHVAKKVEKLNNVYDISSFDEKKIDKLLSLINVEEVWGIGRQYGKLLHKNNINSALDLKHVKDSWIRKHMTVVGLRTVYELRNQQALELEEITPPNKQIVSSRSFGKDMSDKKSLEEAVATYATRAARRLRRQNLYADHITVFITTNRFKEDQPQYSNSKVFKLPEPTNDTKEIIKIAHKNLDKIFKSDFKYKKAGVMLDGIVPEEQSQTSLFTSEYFRKRNQKLMQEIDAINDKWGKNTVTYASNGRKNSSWKMRREIKTPSYTTCWQEIPVAEANNKQHHKKQKE
ncbi:MAG: Y-family DNA polymerase [Candidatus Cloacimonetes bacterium]|nr:Y-family DNA polymerase [Candidatus Cloacimonadota bacterium]